MSPSNIQTLPRQNKDVKRAFIPKLDAFMAFDYQAIEMRMLAYYMATQGDLSLANEFKAGMDPHLETAKGLFPGREITDEMRQTAKVLNFSLIYGGGVATLIRQLKITRTQAAELLRDFHRVRPGVKELKEAVIDRYQQVGYLRTLWDRRLHPAHDYKALNYLIQGCSADLMRSALQKVHDELSLPWVASHIVNCVHDEILCDVREDEIEMMAECIPRLMGDDVLEKLVPIEVSIELSRTTWADKEDYVGV